MSPEKGILEYYENIKRAEGETGAAEFARVLREQYGDLIWPSQGVSDQEVRLAYLWQNSSPELQARFMLPDRKESQKSRPVEPKEPKEPPASKKPPVLPQERSIHPKLREALSGIKFSFLEKRTREFLLKAIGENALVGIPIRNRNIFGTYFLSRATLTEVGDIYGISHGRARQINSSVLNKVFPENAIPLSKSTDNLPPEWLLVQDNLGSQIIEALEQAKTTDEITLILGISRRQSILRLRLLKKLGFALPADLRRTKNENLALAQKLSDDSLLDEEVQELLNQVRFRFYQVYTKGENPVLIPIINLVFNLGYHPSFIDKPLFIESVRAAKIPTGHITREVKSGPQKGLHEYSFIASVHKDRVKEALEQDQSLQDLKENPVEQISGPNIKLSTTSELMPKNKLFRSPIHIFKEFGINQGQYIHLGLGEFFNSSCPVPVFRTKHGALYYPINQEEALRAYIKQKLENRG